MHQKSVSLEKCSSETRFKTPVWLWGSLIKRKKKQSARVQSLKFHCNTYLNMQIKNPTCVPLLNKACMDVLWCSTNQMRETGFKICPVVLIAKHQWIFNSHLWLLHKKYPEEKVSDWKICYNCIMHQNYYIGWKFLLFYTKSIQFNYNLPLKYTILFMLIFKLFLFLL